MRFYNFKKEDIRRLTHEQFNIFYEEMITISRLEAGEKDVDQSSKELKPGPLCGEAAIKLAQTIFPKAKLDPNIRIIKDKEKK